MNTYWSRHMDYLIPKLQTILGTVIKVNTLSNKRSLVQLYHFLINSQCSYCLLNW